MIRCWLWGNELKIVAEVMKNDGCDDSLIFTLSLDVILKEMLGLIVLNNYSLNPFSFWSLFSKAIAINLLTDFYVLQLNLFFTYFLAIYQFETVSDFEHLGICKLVQKLLNLGGRFIHW